MELVSEAEAVDYPAGRARDDPNQNPTLDPPKSALFASFHTISIDSNVDHLLFLILT